MPTRPDPRKNPVPGDAERKRWFLQSVPNGSISEMRIKDNIFKWHYTARELSHITLNGVRVLTINKTGDCTKLSSNDEIKEIIIRQDKEFNDRHILITENKKLILEFNSKSSPTETSATLLSNNETTNLSYQNNGDITCSNSSHYKLDHIPSSSAKRIWKMNSDGSTEMRLLGENDIGIYESQSRDGTYCKSTYGTSGILNRKTLQLEKKNPRGGLLKSTYIYNEKGELCRRTTNFGQSVNFTYEFGRQQIDSIDRNTLVARQNIDDYCRSIFPKWGQPEQCTADDLRSIVECSLFIAQEANDIPYAKQMIKKHANVILLNTPKTNPNHARLTKISSSTRLYYQMLPDYTPPAVKKITSEQW